MLTIFIPFVATRAAIYEVELDRWEISNDGTNPIQTTQGINDALIWAAEKGYTTFSIPMGTYLIAKGTKERDEDARINMVSDMTFRLHDDAVIQKETNGFEIYDALFLGGNVRNVSIVGGTYRGDRDSHDYSGKGDFTGGTHEWGTGISTAGAENIIIDDVKIEKFTGDGVSIGGATLTGSYVTEKELESGALDNQGNPILQEGKVRSNDRKVTHFDHKIYDEYRNVYMWLPEGIKQGSKFDIYYYDENDNYIKADKSLRFYSGESNIPENADYFRVVYDADSPKGVKVNRMTVAITKHITIQNSDIGHNRRQGITVGASDGVLIKNNTIHNISGTAPQSGIDIEPGYYPARNIMIKENTFLDNKIHMVAAYGETVTIEGNYFGKGLVGHVGLAISSGYRGVDIRNNVFENSGIVVSAPATIKDTKITNGRATFNGSGIAVDGIEAYDAKIGTSSDHPHGITISNVTLKSTNDKSAGFSIEKQSILLNNITLIGPFKERAFGGNVVDGSIFTNVKILGYNSKYSLDLPRGIYKNCVFEAGEGGNNGPQANKAGEYAFDNCTFITKRSGLSVNNPNTEVTIKNSIFEVLNGSGYEPIQVNEAKRITALNNTINIRNE